jgi:hypothetical protein
MASSAVKRVTVNLPKGLLEAAERATGEGPTRTIIQGLELLARRRAYAKALALRGKIHLKVDLERSRERNRR